MMILDMITMDVLLGIQEMKYLISSNRIYEKSRCERKQNKTKSYTYFGDV